MKKHFITGLVVLLPLALTIVVITFIFNLLTGPFVGIFEHILHHFNLLERDFGFLPAKQVQEYASKLLVIIFLVSITTLFGFLARVYFFSHILAFWDWVLHRIPFVGAIYKTSQEGIKTLLSSEGVSFQQVVLAPFPHADTESVGFVTKEHIPPIADDSNEKLTAVFIPTALNPTSGFFIMYPESELKYVDMKVDEAFKYLMSCGALKPPMNLIHVPPFKEQNG
jgi:uncharacterized membrane protein